MNAASNCYNCRHAEGCATGSHCALLYVEGWADHVLGWWRSQAVPTNAATIDGAQGPALPRDADGCPHWEPKP